MKNKALEWFSNPNRFGSSPLWLAGCILLLSFCVGLIVYFVVQSKLDRHMNQCDTLGGHWETNPPQCVEGKRLFLPGEKP